MSSLSLYLHTLRQLRPRQIGARVWHRLYTPRVRLGPTPILRDRPAAYCEPVLCSPSLLAPNTFRLLGVERACTTADDWRPADAEKLWTYNLHYFDDLNAAGGAQRADWHRALLKRWLVEVQPGQGDAWEPYPVSRRIVNWIKWSLRGNELSSEARASLAAQARWLMQRLEHHVLGNHLLANAKALLYAGAFYAGGEADRWRATGLGILARELPEQILPDGGHFELSPMYHASVLEDMLDLINLQQAYGREAPAHWRDAAERMRRWLRIMQHPDGEIPFFNDSAFGVAPRCAELESYAERLGLPRAAEVEGAVLVLPDSGYVRMRAGRAALFCDCASVGPSYQPGHAHADTLSFELSLGARRLLVNSGTSLYGLSAERHRQRSTAAHNTVVVDGANSSEVWAGFRVARRARAFVHDLREGETLTLEASHDGYRRLPGAPEHRRKWTLRRDGLHIDDRITGAFDTAEAYFHLHPDVRAASTGSNVELTGPDGPVAAMKFEGAPMATVEAGSWHPRFGVAIPNQLIRVRLRDRALSTRIDWPA